MGPTISAVAAAAIIAAVITTFWDFSANAGEPAVARTAAADRSQRAWPYGGTCPGEGVSSTAQRCAVRVIPIDRLQPAR